MGVMDPLRICLLLKKDFSLELMDIIFLFQSFSSSTLPVKNTVQLMS